MREILFRGKRKDNGEWIEGLTLQWGGDIDSQHEKHLFLTPNGYSFPLDIDPKTICQYTGLTDKNGRKIFEGDIVKIPYEHMEDNICKVIFRRGMFIGEAIDGCEDSIIVRGIEVIGNIFDNPELIGERP